MKRKTTTVFSTALAAGLLLASATPLNVLAAPPMTPAEAINAKNGTQVTDAYNLVEAENANERSAAFVSTQNDITFTGIKGNGYIASKNVDFSKGIASVTVKADARSDSQTNTLEVRLDGVDGELLTSFDISESQDFKSVGKRISTEKPITGTHDIYFVVKGNGTVNLDSWKVMADPAAVTGGKTDTPVTTPGETDNSPYTKVEAENYSELEGGSLHPSKRVVLVKEGGHIASQTVNFDKGISKITIALSAAGTTEVEVRVDGANGDKLATLSLEKEQTKTVDVAKSITGEHKLYFIAKSGNATLDYWSATEGTKTDDPVTPPVVEAASPYDTVEAEDYSELEGGSLHPSKKVVLVKEGGHIASKTVNFDKGVSKITLSLSAEGTAEVEVRVDGANGDKLATVSFNKEKTKTVDVAKSISGEHKLYFVAKSGNATLDSWKAAEAVAIDDPVDPPVVEAASPYDTVEAEDYAELEGGSLHPSKKVVLVKEGGYLASKTVNFDKGVSKITLSLSAAGTAEVEVRVDGANGDKLATLSFNKEQTKTVDVAKSITGEHKLYFVAKSGNATMDSWKATEAGSTETPDPVTGDINPYETIEAEGDNVERGSNTMFTRTKDGVILQENGYIVLKNVDFSKGLSDIEISGRGTNEADSNVDIRIDGIEKTNVIGKVKLSKGTSNVKNTATIKKELTGKHDVYIVNVSPNKANAIVDSIKFTAKGETPDPELPPVVTTVSPYETVEAENYSELEGGSLHPSKKVVLVKEGGHIASQTADFSKGISKLTLSLSAAGTAEVEVRVDGTNGDKIATISFDKEQTKTVDVTKSITGEHKLYFIAKSGNATMDSWKATEAGSTETPDPVVTDVNPYGKVEGEKATKLNDATAESTYAAIKGNGSIVFSNVDFSKGVKTLTVSAQSHKPATTLSVYLDKADGTPIVSKKIMSMGKFEDIVADITSNVTGKHDVIITVDKDADVDFWTATAKEEEQPPVETAVSPYETVEAEKFTELEKGSLHPSKKTVLVNEGGHVNTPLVDFSKGVSKISVALSGASTAEVEVRVDGAAGDKLATIKLNKETSKTVDVTSSITGEHKLYFVVKSGSITLDSWKATEKGEEHVDPIPDPVHENENLKLESQISSWGTGYTVNFKLENTSGKNINTWKVKIKKSDINIASSWCVKITEEGDYYVITPESWNSTIYAGGAAYFGILGNGQIGSSIPYIAE